MCVFIFHHSKMLIFSKQYNIQSIMFICVFICLFIYINGISYKETGICIKAEKGI